MTDEEATLGRNALKHFQDEKFNECSEILKNLSQRRPDDPRVLSNLAVCKFYERSVKTFLLKFWREKLFCGVFS